MQFGQSTVLRHTQHARGSWIAVKACGLYHVAASKHLWLPRVAAVGHLADSSRGFLGFANETQNTVRSRCPVLNDLNVNVMSKWQKSNWPNQQNQVSTLRTFPTMCWPLTWDATSITGICLENVGNIWQPYSWYMLILGSTIIIHHMSQTISGFLQNFPQYQSWKPSKHTFSLLRLKLGASHPCDMLHYRDESQAMRRNRSVDEAWRCWQHQSRFLPASPQERWRQSSVQAIALSELMQCQDWWSRTRWIRCRILHPWTQTIELIDLSQSIHCERLKSHRVTWTLTEPHELLRKTQKMHLQTFVGPDFFYYFQVEVLKVSKGPIIYSSIARRKALNRPWRSDFHGSTGLATGILKLCKLCKRKKIRKKTEI